MLVVVSARLELDSGIVVVLELIVVGELELGGGAPLLLLLLLLLLAEEEVELASDDADEAGD